MATVGIHLGLVSCIVWKCLFTGQAPSLNYKFGLYLLNLEKHQLKRDGELLPLTPKVQAVLEYLVQASGEVVSKADILATVWPDSFVERGSVAQNIFVLRKLFSVDYAESPIETVGRNGYRFREAVEVIDLAIPAVASPTPAAPEFQTVAPKSYGWVAWAVSACLALALAATFLIAHRRNRRLDSSSTIAVLPFRNLSNDPGKQWLSEALREMLSTELNSGGAFNLVSEQDVDRARTELGMGSTDGISPSTSKKLCHALDCRMIVSGSYVPGSNNLQLDLHVIDADTGSTVASYSLHQPEAQLELLVVDGGNNIRHHFNAPADVSASNAEVAASISPDPTAYRLYIEAQQFFGVSNFAGAVDNLKQSIAQDPKFALSHSLLSEAYTQLGQGKEAARESDLATALAGNLSREDQLRILARSQEAHHQVQDSAATLQTLAALRPENADYAIAAAMAKTSAGHNREAVADLQRIIATDQRPKAYNALSGAYVYLGEFQNSLNAAQRCLDEARRRDDRTDYGRCLVSASQAQFYLHQLPAALANTTESLAIARRYRDTSAELRALNRLGQIYIALGRNHDASEVLRQALEREQQLGEVKRQVHTLAELGDVAAKLDDHKTALDYYDRELALAKIFAHPDIVTGAELDIAKEHARVHEREVAERELTAVAATAHAAGDKSMEKEALQNSARVLHELGQDARGLVDIDAAIELSASDTSATVQAELYDLQARIDIALHNHEAAVDAVHDEEKYLAKVDPSPESASRLGETHQLLDRHPANVSPNPVSQSPSK